MSDHEPGQQHGFEAVAPHETGDICYPRAPVALLRDRLPVFTRPRDREEKRAVFDRLHVVREIPIQGKQRPGRQIERSTFRSNEDVAHDDLNRHPSLRLMDGKSRVCLERDEGDAQVLILDECLGVLPSVHAGFPMELLHFPLEIAFEKGSTHLGVGSIKDSSGGRGRVWRLQGRLARCP